MNKLKSVTMSLYKYVCRGVSISRFGTYSLDRSYCISAHMHRVSILGMTIADQYNLENPTTPIDVLEVMRKAALHDVEEGFFGDIPTPAKNIIPELKAAYKKAANKAMEEIILVGSPLPELYLKMWKEDKDGPSGEVIVIADMLEAFCTACYELKRGNKVLSKAFLKYVNEFENGAGKPLLEKFTLAKQIYEENKAMVNMKEAKNDEGFEAA